MMLLHTDVQVLEDVSIGIRIHLAQTFKLRPSEIKVQWLRENGAIFPEVALPPTEADSGRIRDEITEMYRTARIQLREALLSNSCTRFHGGQKTEKAPA